VSEPDLSVVIPAFNEAGRLPRSLDRVRAFLQAWGGSHEVLVADDGSTDETAEKARAAGATVLREDRNRGKGHAVRRGMLAARGRRRLMTDADLSTPIEELPRFLEKMDEGYDVVIGSRALASSRIEVHQPWYRENMGRVYNLFVRALALPGLRDTQCGFKLWSAGAARDAFGAARLDGFSFDVEVLYLARKHGYRIAEIPVTWRNDAATRVGLGGGSLAFPDLVKIRWHDWKGRYEGGEGGQGL
jgi:dolichyl-phosphate beta-glucosyltransferase